MTSEDLRPAESTLMARLWSDEIVQIGDGKVPDHTDPSREIRAGFLRNLILYHDPLPEWGVRFSGAWISGQLNLEGADLPRSLQFQNCLITAPLEFTAAHLQSLYLNGACLRGLNANWLRAEGMVSLQAAFMRGAVKLTGARLGGDLDCSRARLVSRIKSIDGTGLKADTLHFSRARIRGQVRLTGAQLSGDVIFLGVEIRSRNGDAISMSRAKIGGGLYLPQGRKSAGGRPPIGGRLRLTAARASFLSDPESGWPAANNLELNRFEYGAIVDGPVTAEARITWLSLQSGAQFYPQPWEQCARVLREMGHAEDAREVLIAKERAQRRDARRQMRARKEPVRMALSWTADKLLHAFVQYGHQPLRALSWMLLLWVIGVGVFEAAARKDALRPNTPIVLRAPEWTGCELVVGELWQPGETQRACFHRQPAGADYPEFNRYVYSADTLIPLVSLEMQEYWMPNDTATHPIGTIASWYLVFQIFAGWALSLLAVAGFTGLIRSRS